jgi:hypothetical protein
VRKICLLDEAYLDLQAGHLFYEKQVTGLGGYFLDSLSPTLTLWPSMPVSTRSVSVDITECFRNGFLLLFTIAFSLKRFWFMQCWIAEENLHG